jgi:hypothetical protein
VERPQALNFIRGSLDGPPNLFQKQLAPAKPALEHGGLDAFLYPVRSAASSPHEAAAANITMPPNHSRAVGMLLIC